MSDSLTEFGKKQFELKAARFLSSQHNLKKSATFSSTYVYCFRT